MPTPMFIFGFVPAFTLFRLFSSQVPPLPALMLVDELLYGPTLELEPPLRKRWPRPFLYQKQKINAAKRATPTKTVEVTMAIVLVDLWAVVEVGSGVGCGVPVAGAGGGVFEALGEAVVGVTTATV